MFIEYRNSIKLEDAFEEFIFQKKIGGEKARTIKDHITHLNYFKGFLKLRNKAFTYVEQIDKKTCQKYIEYMLEEKVLYDDHQHITKDKKGLSPSTINIRTNSLKAQFNFYVEEGYIQQSPWKGIKKLKVDETEPKFLSVKDYSLLLKAPDRKTFHGFRDYCILNILLDDGPRITETLNLTLDDVNFEELYIKYPPQVTKDREFRIVPIRKRTGFLLKQLIKMNNEVNDEAFHIFLSSTTGKKLAASSFRSNLTKYKEKAGITEPVHPHKLRHTFCIDYLRNGGDPRSMMAIMGHTTEVASKKYSRFSTNTLREIKGKHSPLSQKD